jgi:hypothetical protein
MPSAKQEIDIEHLLWWAVEQTGRLPWEGTRHAELAFDRGCTAKPRSHPVVPMHLALACAGTTQKPRPICAKMTPQGDAAIVLAAIKRLPARDAALILACARQRIRPEWRVRGLAQAERVSATRRDRKRHKRVTFETWRDGVTPEAIWVARGEYIRWCALVLGLADQLRSSLVRHAIPNRQAFEFPWVQAEYEAEISA